MGGDHFSRETANATADAAKKSNLRALKISLHWKLHRRLQAPRKHDTLHLINLVAILKNVAAFQSDLFRGQVMGRVLT